MLDGWLLSGAPCAHRVVPHWSSGDYRAVIVRQKQQDAQWQRQKTGRTLAHLADTVTVIAEQVTEHGEVQRNILAVLNELLETNRAQSEMLADILGAASQEAGPSPVAEALEALAGSGPADGREPDEFDRRWWWSCRRQSGRQFEISLKDWSMAAATKH